MFRGKDDAHSGAYGPYCRCYDKAVHAGSANGGVDMKSGKIDVDVEFQQSLAMPAEDCKWIDLPKIHDSRGNLTFIEAGRHVPFTIGRAFWIYDVPAGSVRGGHAYRTVHEFIIALSGSLEVIVNDGLHKVCYTLNRPDHALLVPNLIWRQMVNFSTNSVALVLASGPFDPLDYIHDYGEFLRRRGLR